jgi:hypothetical protein
VAVHPLRAGALAAAAFGAVFLSYGAPAAAKGGGTAYYYRPDFIYNGAPWTPPAGPKGSLVHAPVTIDRAQMLAVQGEALKGDVIGQFVLRPRAARILNQDVAGARRLIPAGTALVEVVPDNGKGPGFWCDIRPNDAGTHRDERDCLSDSVGAGSFDQIWRADSPSYFMGVGASAVRSPKTLSVRAAFRPAGQDEIPLGHFGYEWCGGDGVTTPPRFSIAAGVPGDGRWTTDASAGCVLGLWPSPGEKGRLDIDGLALDVGPGASTGALRYKFADPTSGPGPLASKTFGAASSASVATSHPNVGPEQKPASASREARALVGIGVPPSVTSGATAKGQDFFSVQVRHGMTGVLRNSVESRAFLSDRTLPLDQPLFGIPMAGSSAATVVWCAPQRAGAGGDLHWTAACLVDSGRGYVWVDAHPAMMTLDLQWSAGGGRAASPPSIEPRHVDLPAMTLSYAFGGWTKQNWAEILERIDWGEGPQLLRKVDVPPDADGVATVRLMGGEILVRPAPPAKNQKPSDVALIEVRVSPKADAEISY